MAATITFRPDDKATAQLDDLQSLYPDRTRLLLTAIDELHMIHFPAKHPQPPTILRYRMSVLAESTTCAATDRWMDRGEIAYEAVWSDGRPGQVFSREALETDNIL